MNRRFLVLTKPWAPFFPVSNWISGAAGSTLHKMAKIVYSSPFIQSSILLPYFELGTENSIGGVEKQKS